MGKPRHPFFTMTITSEQMCNTLLQYADKYCAQESDYGKLYAGSTFTVYVTTVEGARAVMPIILNYGRLSDLSRPRRVCEAANASPPILPLTLGCSVVWLELTHGSLRSAFARLGIKTVGQLLLHTKESLRDNHLSEAAIENIVERLEIYDLALKEE